MVKTLLKRSSLKEFLISSEYSGEGALNLIKNEEFHLIVCDMEMKKGNGLYLLEAVESLSINVAFIFFTSSPESVHRKCNGVLKSIVAKSMPRHLITEIEKCLKV